MKRTIAVGLLVVIAMTAVFSVPGSNVTTSSLSDQALSCLQGGRDCELEAILVDVGCFLLTGAAELCAAIAVGYYILCVLGIV